MNILLLSNPYCCQAFNAYGHQVKTCSLNNPGDIRVEQLPISMHSVLSSLPYGWSPDLVLLGDDSRHPMFLGLEFLEIPLGWYVIDSHLHLPWHKTYASVFDFVFVAQKGYVDSYRTDPTRQVVQWLPLFCEPTSDRYLALPKLYDLSFVGTLNASLNPDRVRLIHDIERRFPIHATTGDYVSIFNQSRLVLNQCVADDVNFRTFQAMACGSLLLMEKVGNGLDELFHDRVHLALYDKGNVDQIVELTRYYLQHSSEREEIAAQGREAVLRAHTSTHRAEAILNLLQSCDVNELVRRRKACLPEIEAHLATTYDYASRVYSRFPIRHFHAIYSSSSAAIRRRLEQGRSSFQVSIVVPAFNSVEAARECLIHLAQVTDQVSYEVIVVDDGSTDGTAAFLTALDGDVQIINNREHLGFARACNQGAQRARGRYLVFLKQDTIPQEGWLKALVDEAETHLEVAVVGSKLLSPHGTVQHAGIAFARDDRLPCYVYRGFPANAPEVERRRELQAVSAACMLVRREVFEAVGGFDEAYRHGCEDVDLCLKIREREGRIVYQPNSVLYRPEEPSPGSESPDADDVQRLLERWGERWVEDLDAIYVPDGYVVRAYHDHERVVYRLGRPGGPEEKAQWECVAEVQRLAMAGDIAAVQSLLAQPEAWPLDRLALRWGAKVCARAGVPSCAGGFWQRLLALDGTSEARVALARLALASGDWDEAQQHVCALLALAPEDGEAWLLTGTLALQREDFTEAAVAFERALHCGGDARSARLGLGIVALRVGRIDDAWDSFSEVLAADADDAEAIHWLLRAGTALTRWEALASRLMEFLRLNPGDVAVRFALAGVYVRLEKWEEARQQYDTLRVLQPTFEGLDTLAEAIDQRTQLLV